MNYSKWDSMAKEEEEAEKDEKQRQAQKNKDKYFKEQEERKAKFLEEQKAKKREQKRQIRVVKEQERQQMEQEHGHAHEHHGHAHGGDNHDHNHVHGHGHAHGGGDADHGHAHGPPAEEDDSGSDIDESQFKRGCSCGYADPEELKKRAAAAALEPQLTLEEKNIKKIRAVEATREHGNQLFKEGKYDTAYAVYERGVLISNGTYGLEPADADAMSALECTLDLNMAACKLKLKEWKEAIEQCKLALQINPACVKAFYRMGEAYIGMGEYDDAEIQLQRALELEPQNKQTQNKIKEIATLKQEQIKKQKQAEQQIRENMKKHAAAAKQQT